jgi:hypothetical protein
MHDRYLSCPGVKSTYGAPSPEGSYVGLETLNLSSRVTVFVQQVARVPHSIEIGVVSRMMMSYTNKITRISITSVFRYKKSRYDQARRSSCQPLSRH